LLPEQEVARLFGSWRVARAMEIRPENVDHRAVAEAARSLSACKGPSTQLLMAAGMDDEIAAGVARYLLDAEVREQVEQALINDPDFNNRPFVKNARPKWQQ
jgi:hypothetical protein